MKWIRPAIAIAIAAVVLAAATPAAAIDAVYVFGDSLVDPGNAYIGSGGATAQPYLGYFHGRFSNGPDYTDYISRWATGGYSVPFLQGGTNFAVGGARAAGDTSLLGFDVPGLQSQFSLFLGATGGVIDPNALYIINFGNNDVSAIQSGDTYGLTPAQYGALYAGNIVGAAQYLSFHGATKILVAGVPNPDEPAGVTLEGQLDAALAAATLAPDTTLYHFDFFTFFNELRADPVAFGLPLTIDLNLNHPCIPGQLAFGFPPDCSQFFSFDGTHPTAPVGRALAGAVGDLLGVAVVPEPSMWLQLVAGFGLAGTIVRRRIFVS